jgi:Holliday junction resolvase
MSTKSRGTNAERDLIHRFWEHGWAAMRSAGSGSQHFPSPDVIAGNNVRKLAIECKLTTEQKKYFPKQEIEELKYFAQKFGCEPWVGLKFFRKEWMFFSLEDLDETPASYVIGVEKEHRALSFEQLIK